MDLVVFENNKPFVIDEFREGRFDYVELASDVAETKFFQFLFGQQIVEKLVQSYPSPRERHHVPLWMYVCSQLSLRLHGQHSFHSYPLIIRAGGLVEALGPDVAHREVDPQSGNLTLHCAGFNDRNLHPRQTPCDQDFLRKLARDTESAALWPLLDTFLAAVGSGVMKVLLVDRGFLNGREIGRLKRDHGIDTVIPIGSDMNLQEDVRGLMKLPTTWEEYKPTHRPPLPDPTRASHGQPPHPAAKKRERTRQQTLARQRAERDEKSPPDPSRVRERTLVARFPGLTSWWDCPVPLTGVYSRDVYADGHEDGWLVVTTNEDWSAHHVRDLYGLRTDIEERHRQVKCFWDLTRFYSTAWSLVVSQLVFVCLTYSLLQVHLLRQGHQEQLAD